MKPLVEAQPEPDRSGDIITVGLLAAVLLTALAHGAVEPWSLMLFELIVLALMVLWAVKIVRDRRFRITIPRIVLPMAALVGIGLLQSIGLNGGGYQRSLSLNVEATRRTVIVLTFLLISLVIAANFLANRRRLAMMAGFLATFGLVLAVFALVQNLTWNGKLYWIRPNTVSVSPFGPFVNHNHFAGYMELLIPLPIGLIITGAVRRETRLLYGFAATAMGVALAASLSRGGIISLAAALSFLIAMSARLPKPAPPVVRKPGHSANGTKRGLASLLYRFKRITGSASRTLIVLAIAGAIALGLLWVGADPVVNRISRITEGESTNVTEQQASLTNRVTVWRDTLSMIRAHPLLGVGLGAYETAFPIYSRSDGSIRVPQAHNDYLQALADCGAVGGLIALWFLALTFKAIWRGVRAPDPLISGLALGAGGSVVAILVHSLFDFNLQLPSTALLFLVLSAVLAHASAMATAALKTRALAPSRTVQLFKEQSVAARMAGGTSS